jgi:hypothetical protein
MSVYFPVLQLKVPVDWPVGPVTFRPAGWLRDRLGKCPRGRTRLQRQFVASAVGQLNDEWATADISVLADRDEGANVADAQETVRDAISVLRLYQRQCVDGWDVDIQTFGLAGDIGAEQSPHWQMDRWRLRRWGTEWVGVPAAWEFTRQHADDFLKTPAFAYLDKALRSPDSKRNDLERRAIAAVRTLNFASAMQRQPIRIVLQAVALEALLGDAKPKRPADVRPQAHQVARRAAFLTCRDSAGVAHGPRRPACMYLTEKSATQVQREAEALQRKGQAWECTYYRMIRDLFEARNAALHDAQDRFEPRTAVRFEWWLDGVIQATLAWSADAGARRIGDIDGAISRLPRA